MNQELRYLIFQFKKLYKDDVCFKKVFCPQYYGFKLYKVAKQVSKTFKAIEESDTITQLINKAK